MKIKTQKDLDKYLKGNLKKLSKKNITKKEVMKIMTEQNKVLVYYLKNINETFGKE